MAAAAIVVPVTPVWEGAGPARRRDVAGSREAARARTAVTRNEPIRVETALALMSRLHTLTTSRGGRGRWYAALVPEMHRLRLGDRAVAVAGAALADQSLGETIEIVVEPPVTGCVVSSAQRISNE